MNFVLMLAILGANIIAILLVYQFVKKIGKKESIIFIAISVAAIYIAVSIAYWISGFGIDDNINEAAKNSLVYLFVPVNVILLIPFIASKYAKFKEKKASKRDFVARLIKVAMVGVILLVLECIYFKSIKLNIEKYGILLQNSVEQNYKEEINNNQTNTIENKSSNTTSFQEFLNTTTNTTTDTIENNTIENKVD